MLISIVIDKMKTRLLNPEIKNIWFENEKENC